MRNTENEIINIKKQNLFIIEQTLLKGELSNEDINRLFSGYMHIHKMDTFALEWTSQEVISRFNVDLAKVSEMSQIEYAKKHMHPISIQQLAPRYFNALISKDSAPFDTFQYAKLNDKMDYSWIHNVCSFSFTIGKIISLSHFVKDLERDIQHKEQLLGEHEFLRENYSKFMRLSLRQKEVLSLLALGHTNKSIAYELQVSPNTIRTHRNNIHRILDLRWKNINHSQIYLKYAIAFGLIDI